MKSSAHASVICALTLVSAASRLSTTILRPLMPPRSLHHCEKTSAVSKSSWLRPGRPAKPGSEKVPIWISVGRDALGGRAARRPGLADVRSGSPKSALFALAGPAVVEVVVPLPHCSSVAAAARRRDHHQREHQREPPESPHSPPSGPKASIHRRGESRSRI